MKKFCSIIACLMAVISLVFCLTACGNTTEEAISDVLDIIEDLPVENEVLPAEETPVEEAPTEPTSEIRPEFKEAMDSYEAFYDEYCTFMTKFSEDPSDLSLLGQYASMMSKSTEMTQKFEEWNNEDLSNAELTYYLEVNNRVTQKLLECAQ